MHTLVLGGVLDLVLDHLAAPVGSHAGVTLHRLLLRDRGSRLFEGVQTLLFLELGWELLGGTLLMDLLLGGSVLLVGVLSAVVSVSRDENTGLDGVARMVEAGQQVDLVEQEVNVLL